ncbi:MAG: DUF4130 domain-containing protein [Rhizomicrobium sp.]
MLFDAPPPARPIDLTVPRAFAELMDNAICHRGEDRFALLYDVLWRLKHGEPALLDRATDPAIAKLSLYAKAVRRDIHKMHAFVRFHKQEIAQGELYLAWFEPEHFILKAATPFLCQPLRQYALDHCYTPRYGSVGHADAELRVCPAEAGKARRRRARRVVAHLLPHHFQSRAF